MAEHGDFDLTRLERIERRLQSLEDAEAIRNLKSRYAALCDDNYDADGIAALFTDDATWDSPGLGRFEGRNAIRDFFRGAAGIFSFAIHYGLSGQIYVDGDTARAQWYLFMPCTLADGNSAMWRASIDHERYRRVDGSWLFSEKRSQPLMNVPFDGGRAGGFSERIGVSRRRRVPSRLTSWGLCDSNRAQDCQAAGLIGPERQNPARPSITAFSVALIRKLG
jgi:ketosteroid isomerase-like protein